MSPTYLAHFNLLDLVINKNITYSRAQIAKLIVARVVKDFPSFYRTRRFIFVFTSAPKN